jgi:myo-inositol 2-dehydrogenase / D-chiro-inositol 1-dehydrogenase
MMTSSSSRRRFLASSGLLLVPARTVRGSQANSSLTLGVVGCGNRGLYVSSLFAKNEFLKVTTICDIYDDRLADGEKQFAGATKFKNIKDLLASNVDAVLIATPAFLHPEHFEMAVKSRKHIYLEKPAGVDVPGVRRLQDAARKADPTKRIQMGYQQRYGKDYRMAHQLVQSGELGGIKMVRAAWLGSGAARRTGHPASEEKMRNWYFYRDMSGDILVEQDCHNLDVVNWFMGAHPARSTGYGTRAIRKDIGDVYDSLGVTFQFADGIVFSYSAHQFGRQSYMDVSETFICENGSVNTSRNGILISRGGKPPERTVTKGDITQEAVNEFIEGARTGKIENGALWGAESTLTGIMARESLVRGQEMTWDRLTKS